MIQQHHTQLTQIDICALEDLLEYYFMEILRFKIDKRNTAITLNKLLTVFLLCAACLVRVVA